ncbi:exonuclease [Anoxybacterium hadale]|uniref:Exonuclease n=1 Tax=Anoxybacterium hadale TaxID=3408580 RepID=A0ACD1AC19_9FIRM|nr:exonuclease [Clostridiales bacterium]
MVNSEFDFIVVDFETANNNLDSACSIGIVTVKGIHIVDKLHYFIKPPGGQFRESNTKIHGITFKDVESADTFLELWEKIRHYLEGGIVVAHNAQFDMSVLKNCLDTYNLTCSDFIYIDSISISSLALEEHVGSGLKDRATYFNIPLDNHHNALEDAYVATKLVTETMVRLNTPSIVWLALLNNLPAKQFCNLNATKSFIKKNSKYEKYNHIKISEFCCSQTEFDSNHPLYLKNCVLTGELQTMVRSIAIQKIVDVGGVVKSSVSNKTDFLIVGIQDKSVVGEDGRSSKEEKAYQMIMNGSNIRILNEEDFLKLFMLEQVI